VEVGELAPQYEASQQRSWLGRNWRWLLSLVVGLALVGSALSVFAFNHADATKLAMATARSNPALVQRLGEPIENGWFIGGSIEVTPGSGRADLAIPISGPRGRGTLYALAVKEAGVWRLTLLKFSLDADATRLDLLQ